MESWLYRVLAIILGALSIYLGINLYQNAQKVSTLTEQLTKQFEKESKNRQHLIDSLGTTAILIKKEILNSEESIQKLEKEIKKNKLDTLTLDQALKVLGL